MDSDLRKLIRQIEKLHLEVNRTRSGHYKVTNPKTGEQVTSMSASPRCPGVQVKETLKILRKKGYIK